MFVFDFLTWLVLSINFSWWYFIVNKVKGWISRRWLQKMKARQNFARTDISYPLIDTRTCAYHRVREIVFSENLACFDFL